MSLLPDNATPWELAFEQLMDERLDAINVNVIRSLITIDDAPVQLLPWLAWEASVDEFDSENWTIETQRTVIKSSYALHRKKGTRGAIEQALNEVGVAYTFQEWWEQSPQGTPGTAIVTVVTGQGLQPADEKFKQIERIIQNTQRKSTHHTVQTGLEMNGSLYLGGALTPWNLAYLDFEVQN